MKREKRKDCAICGREMKLTNSQYKQKEICEECARELKKARAEKSYHRLSQDRRFVYWHNIVKAMEATRKGVKL